MITRESVESLINQMPEVLLRAYHCNSIFHSLVLNAAKTGMTYIELLEYSTEQLLNIRQAEIERQINEAKTKVTPLNEHPLADEIKEKLQSVEVVIYG